MIGIREHAAVLAALLREVTAAEIDAGHPCSFDHHGYCQEHGGAHPEDGGCHIPRVKVALENYEAAIR